MSEIIILNDKDLINELDKKEIKYIISNYWINVDCEKCKVIIKRPRYSDYYVISFEILQKTNHVVEFLIKDKTIDIYINDYLDAKCYNLIERNNGLMLNEYHVKSNCRLSIELINAILRIYLS